MSAITTYQEGNDMNTEIPTLEEQYAMRLRHYYRPLVELHGSEFGFVIGDYRFLYFTSRGLRSTGAITYKYLIGVLDPDERDVLYVTAETNDKEGESTIYLGRFSPARHTTITKSPALAHSEFFFPVACLIAREALDVPYERFSLLQHEVNALSAIPRILRTLYPQGILDDETQALYNRLPGFS